MQLIIVHEFAMDIYIYIYIYRMARIDLDPKITLIYLHLGGVTHIFEKLSTKATTFL